MYAMIHDMFHEYICFGCDTFHMYICIEYISHMYDMIHVILVYGIYVCFCVSTYVCVCVNTCGYRLRARLCVLLVDDNSMLLFTVCVYVCIDVYYTYVCVCVNRSVYHVRVRLFVRTGLVCAD